MDTYLLFPRLVEFTERLASANAVRQRVAEYATGHVLELASPAGSNHWHYPRSITSLTSIAAPRANLQRRIRGLPFPMDTRAGSFDHLPVQDHAFDCVVSTFAIGTARDVVPTLREIQRVLKPSGYLLFAEYGLSREPRIEAWQRRLRPLHQLLLGTRAPMTYFEEQLTAAGFTIKRCECTSLARIPRALGVVYEGVAALYSSTELSANQDGRDR